MAERSGDTQLPPTQEPDSRAQSRNLPRLTCVLPLPPQVSIPIPATPLLKVPHTNLGLGVCFPGVCRVEPPTLRSPLIFISKACLHRWFSYTVMARDYREIMEISPTFRSWPGKSGPR